jgi:hypothetical protein
MVFFFPYVFAKKKKTIISLLDFRFHSGDYEECPCRLLIHGFFYPEDGGNTFL